jgi:hypothetical protein
MGCIGKPVNSADRCFYASRGRVAVPLYELGRSNADPPPYGSALDRVERGPCQGMPTASRLPSLSHSPAAAQVNRAEKPNRTIARAIADPIAQSAASRLCRAVSSPSAELDLDA